MTEAPDTVETTDTQAPASAPSHPPEASALAGEEAAAASRASAAPENAAACAARRARRPHGAVRRLRDAGAIPRRHHCRAQSCAHPDRAVRCLAHGTGVPGRRRSRDGRARTRNAGAGGHRQSRARPPALHPAHQRGRRHPRRPDGDPLGGPCRGRRALPRRERRHQGSRLRAPCGALARRRAADPRGPSRARCRAGADGAAGGRAALPRGGADDVHERDHDALRRHRLPHQPLRLHRRRRLRDFLQGDARARHRRAAACPSRA